MKIHTFAVGLLTAAMAGQVVPGKVWGVEVGGASDNAAVVYRQAFDAADRSGVGKAAVMDGDVHTIALDGSVKTLLNENQDVVGLVRQGIGLKNCDWGTLPDDMAGVLKVLNQVRTVERLMTLQAREDLQEKQPVTAVDDWLATVAMARQVGEIKLIIASLVQSGVEMDVIQQMAAQLPGLPAEARTKLVEGWKKLPAGATGAQVMMGEYAYAQKAAVQQKFSKALIDVLEPYYKAIGAASGDAPAQFDKVVDEQIAKFKLNPFAQTIGPSIKRTREPAAALEAKRAMLETAILVVEKGPGEVAKSKDPFGAGPFQYTETKGGFELSSALAMKNKPVALRVGN